MSVNTIHLTPQSQTLRFLRLGVRIKYLREGIKTLCVRLRYRCHPAVDLSHAENAENAENACCTRVGHPDGSKGEAACNSVFPVSFV